MEFLKKNVKIVIGVILGTLLTGGIVFATGQYNASEVTYNTNTVAGALDNLYNYAKNKSDLAEQMNKPNTWEVGREYDFGNGIYGQRFTGTITKAIDTREIITLRSGNSVISSGGWFDWGGSNAIKVSVGQPWTMSDGSISTLSSYVYVNNGNIMFATTSNSERTNAPYEVWVLYTK